MKLRDYQSEAVDAAARSLAQLNRVLVVAATGSGKSAMVAAIAARYLDKFKDKRVLVLCHTQEILVQNELTLNRIEPWLTTGIYCAGVNRKDTAEQVIFASRDSLGRNPLVCGTFDLILCDEAHTISIDVEKSTTMYSRIFEAQQARWVVGFTATPWRIAGGNIWGKGKFFEKVVYNITIDMLVQRGFLSPYVFPACDTKIDTSGLKVASTGDYKISELEKVSGSRAICETAVSEWMRKASTRRCSLFFCVSRAHGKLLTEVISERIGAENVVYIDALTKNRDVIIADLRKGKYRAAVNIATMTTGIDIPIIDCIVMLRPTASASLFVQIAGRGLRLHQGKSNVLILDFTDNFDRFESLETPKVASHALASVRESDDLEPGNAPTKECPSCAYKNIPARATYCPFCGEVFVKALLRPFEGERRPELFKIIHTSKDDYVSKAGNFCKRVSYYTDKGIYREYFAVNKSPYALRIFQRRTLELERRPHAMLALKDKGLVDVKEFFYEVVENENL